MPLLPLAKLQNKNNFIKRCDKWANLTLSLNVHKLNVSALGGYFFAAPSTCNESATIHRCKIAQNVKNVK